MTITLELDILVADLASSIKITNPIPANMTKNSYQQPSPQTQEEALKIAKRIQRPAQTKEQTKLITQGIQQGIDLYKRQQKEKARELNKQRKKLAKQKAPQTEQDNPETAEIIIYQQHWLPWLLLILTWLAIGLYFVTGHSL